MAVAKKHFDTDTALTVESLTKRYVPVERKFTRLFFNKSTPREVVALDNVSFSLPKGQVLGIVGRNGAGKSTLLRILAGITHATSGKVTIHGRFASILEIGTGFHPDLSGRENIYFNGELLGFSRKEIAARFDQIVEFSGVGEFIDLPIKQYSNGMYLRLAFSVAFHSDIEILLLDEILAVGDAEFQQKSYQRIQELANNGTSIILVSHNLSSISRICDRVIQLDRGKIVGDGNPQEILAGYAERAMQLLVAQSQQEREGFSAQEGVKTFSQWEIVGLVRLRRIAFWNEGKAEGEPLVNTAPIVLEMLVEKLVEGQSLEVAVRVMDISRSPILVDSLALGADYTAQELPVGLYRYRCIIPVRFFSHGFYPLAITFSMGGNQWVGEIDNLPGLRIFPDLAQKNIHIYAQIGAPIQYHFEWESEKLEEGSA